MRRWTGRSLLITLTLCLLSLLPVQAQENLLVNPGFESDYSGRMGRGDFTFPAGWDGWFTDAPHTEAWMNVPPTGYPHNGPFKRSGTNAQSIAKGGGTFTAAALQRVSDIPAGAVVRGSAWIYIENKDGTNAQVRIGVGSNVGTNVNGAITWSAWEKRINGLHQISVDHVATGGEVTIVIYATQTWPNDPNAVYIDDASLTIIGEGEAPASTNDTGVVAVATAPSDDVPFVAAQTEADDGGVTHTVSAGDTLSSISVAYGIPVAEIVALNNLTANSFLQLGQELIISKSDSADEDETSDTSTTDETDDSPEATIEVSGSIISESAESPTPSVTPTETPVPDTATPAPTAPVTEADAQDVDPTTLEPGICVGMFDDINQNGTLNAGETYLSDGIIRLVDSNDEELVTYLTDGESEPSCFEDLDNGRYSLNGIAPDGYGLTTSPVLRVNLEDGATVIVRFGAKQGLEVLAIPTVDTRATPIPPDSDASNDASSDLAQYSGLIVFGLAGAVLVLGFGASLLMRRR